MRIEIMFVTHLAVHGGPSKRHGVVLAHLREREKHKGCEREGERVNNTIINTAMRPGGQCG